MSWFAAEFARAIADGMDTRLYDTPYLAVMDPGRVITLETAAYIEEETGILQRKTGAEFYLAAVPGCLPDCDSYATELFNAVGVGDREKNNGVLFLMDTRDHHLVLRTGSGVEDVITDGKAGRILDDYAVAPAKENKWNLAARNTFAAVMTELYGKYQMPLPAGISFAKEDVPEMPQEQQITDPVPLPPPPENFWIGIGSGVLCFIFLLWRITVYYRDPRGECSRWKTVLGVMALFLLECLFNGGGSSGGGSGRSHGGGGSRGGGASR
ncbi:MAG: TPM domain-containing protein [Succinimonas sp.]|nr:TPM domain-containing protein [Succinimonas sp.]